MQTIYVYEVNGKRKEFDEPQENLRQYEVSSTPATIVVTNVTPAISDPDYEEGGSTPVDDWEWNEDYETEKTP